MIGRWLARHQPVWLEQLRLGAPLRVGATGEIALGLSAKWAPGECFVQVLTLIDETQTHKGAPFMVLAGHTARLGEWNRFDLKWRKELKKAGLDYFHAKEHHDLPFARKGPKITNDHLMFGFVVRLSPDDYKKHYRDGDWPAKVQPRSMYGLCFVYVLGFVLKQAQQILKRSDLTLNFVVESGHANAGAPAEIVRELKKKKIPGLSEYLGYATEGEKKELPGLQAADGVAFGGWHLEAAREGRVFQTPRGPERRLPVWIPQAAKMPVYICDINEEELATYKKDYLAHVEHRRQFGQARHAERLSRPSSGSSEDPTS